jgi:hypothetical protein
MRPDRNQLHVNAMPSACNPLRGTRDVLNSGNVAACFQVGTASVDMQELLRQGREFSEVLVEVPVSSQQSATSGNLSAQATHSTWEERGLGTEGGRAATEQRGTLLLRLINIGREPSDLDSKQAAFDAVQTTRGAQPGQCSVHKGAASLGHGHAQRVPVRSASIACCPSRQWVAWSTQWLTCTGVLVESIHTAMCEQHLT